MHTDHRYRTPTNPNFKVFFYRGVEERRGDFISSVKAVSKCAIFLIMCVYFFLFFHKWGGYSK
jgi:hypothetical protein